MTSLTDCLLGVSEWYSDWIAGTVHAFIINKSQSWTSYGDDDCVGRTMFCEIESKNNLGINTCRKDLYDFLD